VCLPGYRILRLGGLHQSRRYRNHHSLVVLDLVYPAVDAVVLEKLIALLREKIALIEAAIDEITELIKLALDNIREAVRSV